MFSLFREGVLWMSRGFGKWRGGAIFLLLISCSQQPVGPVVPVPIPKPTPTVTWERPCQPAPVAIAPLAAWMGSDDCVAVFRLSAKGVIATDTGTPVIDFARQVPARGSNAKHWQPLVTVEQINAAIASNLRDLDRYGILMHGGNWWLGDKKTRIVSNGAESGVKALAEQLRSASTVVITDATATSNFSVLRRLSLSAVYDAAECRGMNQIGARLDVPPYNFRHMFIDLAVEAEAPLAGDVTLVKLSLDLTGKMTTVEQVATLSPCTRFIDSTFDPALASAYYIKLNDQLITSPLWYAPIQG